MTMDVSSSSLHLSLILILTIYLCQVRCEANDVRPFVRNCAEPIDCGTNHVIAIADVNLSKPFRVLAKNNCNGKHTCEAMTKEKSNCYMKYYCIEVRFMKNCSIMDAPNKTGTGSDVSWCYQHASHEKRKSFCWEFSEDLYHHWVVLRGWMKIKNQSNGMPMTNFELIKRENKNQVCTSSKYIWIIYVGTSSPDAPVNIFSNIDPTATTPNPGLITPSLEERKTAPLSITKSVTNVQKDEADPTITTSDQGSKGRTKVNPEDEVTKDNLNNATGASQNGYPTDKKENGDSILKDKQFMKIIIFISAIGGVLIILAITIAILWCCCRRCNNVTINNKPDPEPRKDSYTVVKNVETIDKKVEAKELDCQIREGFIPTDAVRDTFDSVGFWTDDEDYDPNDDYRHSGHSKQKPTIYAVGNCVYEPNPAKTEIYMNTGVPPPPCIHPQNDVYINMNQKPQNKHFNVFL